MTEIASVLRSKGTDDRVSIGDVVKRYLEDSVLEVSVLRDAYLAHR